MDYLGSQSLANVRISTLFVKNAFYVAAADLGLFASQFFRACSSIFWTRYELQKKTFYCCFTKKKLSSSSPTLIALWRKLTKNSN